jgi:hypothetical protein
VLAWPDWLAMRSLRNRLVHEYIDTPEALAPALEQACRFTDAMHPDYEAIRAYLCEASGPGYCLTTAIIESRGQTCIGVGTFSHDACAWACSGFPFGVCIVINALWADTCASGPQPHATQYTGVKPGRRARHRGGHDRRGIQENVRFEPFTGVGARRFLDLFSMSLGGGSKLKRKDKQGATVEWKKDSAGARTPLLPKSYLEVESAASDLWQMAGRSSP